MLGICIDGAPQSVTFAANDLKSLLCLLLFLSTLAAQGQSKEYGVFLGASNYHGDLADEIVLKESHLSAGIFYRKNFNEFWTWRPMLSYMRISGSDANFDANRIRNLSFRNDILEISNLIELNYEPFSKQAWHNKFTTFVFAGISLYHHNPMAERDGEYYELRPMNTENLSSKERYQNFQLSVPFGGGFKVAFTPNFIGSVEVGWRATFTDYLDDVSGVYPETSPNMQFTDRSWELNEDRSFVAEAGDMRGDPHHNDWYLQAGITLSYRLTPILCWATK